MAANLIDHAVKHGCGGAVDNVAFFDGGTEDVPELVARTQ